MSVCGLLPGAKEGTTRDARTQTRSKRRDEGEKQKTRNVMNNEQHNKEVKQNVTADTPGSRFTWESVAPEMGTRAPRLMLKGGKG